MLGKLASVSTESVGEWPAKPTGETVAGEDEDTPPAPARLPPSAASHLPPRPGHSLTGRPLPDGEQTPTRDRLPIASPQKPEFKLLPLKG